MVLTKLKRLLHPATRELARAERDLRDLLGRTAEDRAGMIGRARSRFRQPMLVRLLLEESRKRIPADPAEAYLLAELAWRMANRYPGMPGYADLYVLAVAHMANARRVGGDRRRANELFTLARRALMDLGVTDPAVVARVDDLLGSLRKDQRRLPEAARLLRRAAMQFGLINARPDAARVLINLGAVYHDQKDSARAIETTRSALALLGPEAEPRLHVCGLYNLAVYLTEEGRFEEAGEVLEWNEGLFRRFPEPWTQLRLLWLRGDIAGGMGDLAAAEQAYAECRAGFVAEGVGYDAALVSLDLAAVYLRQGRTADARRLAGEVIPVFQAQDVQREAMAALVLFQEAAEKDLLPGGVLGKLGGSRGGCAPGRDLGYDTSMARSLEDLRIEMVDVDMARLLRAKPGAERLKIASGMFASARRMIASHLAAEHPDWDDERIQRETSRRVSHGAL
jgi:tetratricopeptide (TPR) repeat protein